MSVPSERPEAAPLQRESRERVMTEYSRSHSDGARGVAEPLRVMHVITGLGVGGAEAMLASLVGARPEGLDQTVVSLIPDGFHASPIRQRGVSVFELAFDRRSHIPADLWHLARLIRDIAPQIVQGWMYHGNIAAMIALALARRRPRTRLAWGIRCSDRASSNESLQLSAVIRTGAYLSPLIDALVANSHAGLDYHAHQGYSAPRQLVIHNGIDTERFHPDAARRSALRLSLGLATTDFVVAHVARMHPMKDHATFVEAMRQLPNVKALAIGAGTESLPQLPNLHRLGRRSDVPALLVAADVVVSSSAYGEGFSNAVAEGMAAGLVPVATDVGDTREIVGDTGVVVPPRSPSALARGVAEVAALSPEESHRRGLRSRERIRLQFGLETATTKFASLYRDLAIGLPGYPVP